ncbi:MAG: hypothetical protein MRERC_4c060 [Mycoplasmataceae bacterium RC_NB112A]|nr:MAG: hypothetical protein MRERC_4c060 [Mycoplasmataceae bacterium RC_NB112A]
MVNAQEWLDKNYPSNNKKLKRAIEENEEIWTMVVTKLLGFDNLDQFEIFNGGDRNLTFEMIERTGVYNKNLKEENENLDK